MPKKKTGARLLFLRRGRYGTWVVKNRAFFEVATQPCAHRLCQKKHEFALKQQAQGVERVGG
jgi:hypothetical protein